MSEQSLELSFEAKVQRLAALRDEAEKCRKNGEKQMAEIKVEMDRKVAELSQSHKQITDGLTIADLLRMTPKDVRPKLIPVGVTRNCGKVDLLLFQMKDAPQCAALAWTAKYNTQYSIRLGDPKLATRSFTLACGCCSPDIEMIEEPINDRNSKEYEEWFHGAGYKEWRKRSQQALKAKLGEVCSANGISILFVRKAECWKHNIGSTRGVRYFEGGEFRPTLERFCGTDQVDKILEALEGDLR